MMVVNLLEGSGKKVSGCFQPTGMKGGRTKCVMCVCLPGGFETRNGVSLGRATVVGSTSSSLECLQSFHLDRLASLPVPPFAACHSCLRALTPVPAGALLSPRYRPICPNQNTRNATEKWVVSRHSSMKRKRQWGRSASAGIRDKLNLSIDLHSRNRSPHTLRGALSS